MFCLVLGRFALRLDGRGFAVAGAVAGVPFGLRSISYAGRLSTRGVVSTPTSDTTTRHSRVRAALLPALPWQ